MDGDLRQDLLFCRSCGKHFRGQRRRCPNDDSTLEMVRPFEGQVGDLVDDRYRLEQRIGVGGMGTVWRAFDQMTDRRVALKLLNPRYATHAGSAKRFLAEARLMRKLSHPGVVALHRFGPTADGALLIDMEHIVGETVRERMLRLGHGVPIDLGLRVLDGVLAALGACHDVDIVHCDVKPENVMLVEGGVAGACKLLDFGIAQAAGPIEHGDDFVVLGTPAFMSPEQVRGTSVDARSDLYLVGALAFELLTGEPPFVGDNPLELCHHQMLTPAPTLRSRLPGVELPEGLEAWVAAMVEKDPERRPRHARAARDALRQVRLQHQGLGRARPGIARSAHAGRALTPSMLRPVAAASRVLRALIEVRQVGDEGMVYGPRAIEEISSHLLAGGLAELREIGAEIVGPEGPFVDVRIACDQDERGVIHHLLDVLSRMHAEVRRIPEPRLEIRAAVLADAYDAPATLRDRPQHEMASLLRIGADSHVRIDERVARWAGRRPIVKLASMRESGFAGVTTLYATTLQAY